MAVFSEKSALPTVARPARSAAQCRGAPRNTDPSDIQVKIFDDKITLFSPGTFYGGLTVAEIRADNYRSSLRNKLVAEGFYLVNAIEKYGSGFIRIRHALNDYPEIQFDIEEKFGGVMVTYAQTHPGAERVMAGRWRGMAG